MTLETWSMRMRGMNEYYILSLTCGLVPPPRLKSAYLGENILNTIATVLLLKNPPISYAISIVLYLVDTQ